MSVSSPDRRRGRSYSDAELARAVISSNSWRAVLRALGLSATSASAIRSVRRHVLRLQLDCSHFTGGRRWTDAQLANAIGASHSWTQVARTLGLTGGSSESQLKGHALRLNLDASHFGAARPMPSRVQRWASADPRCLGRAGSLLAAAWFTLRGCDVAWPLEPCRYDLLVTIDGAVQRVQVKTTTVRSGNTWAVALSKSGKRRVIYDPDEIDYFFVIDGDYAYYLIPLATVGGLHAINLSAYRAYQVNDLTTVAARAGSHDAEDS